jgi:hypothetical protein
MSNFRTFCTANDEFQTLEEKETEIRGLRSEIERLNGVRIYPSVCRGRSEPDGVVGRTSDTLYKHLETKSGG